MVNCRPIKDSQRHDRLHTPTHNLAPVPTAQLPKRPQDCNPGYQLSYASLCARISSASASAAATSRSAPTPRTPGRPTRDANISFARTCLLGLATMSRRRLARSGRTYGSAHCARCSVSRTSSARRLNVGNRARLDGRSTDCSMLVYKCRRALVRDFGPVLGVDYGPVDS